MKNLLTLLVTICFLTGPVNAQRSRSQTPPPAPRPVPKGPPPYVLKKDYEPKMAEMAEKINTASSAASTAKRNMENNTNQIRMLDSQVHDIQTILNSANFQIAMNADTLKETRFSMETLKQKTDDNFNHIEETNASLSQTVWILFGIAVIICLSGFVFLISLLGKRMNRIQVMLHLNEEVLKKTLATGMEKQHKEFKDELHGMESRFNHGSVSLKRELQQQLTTEKESTAAAIHSLSTKLEMIEQATSLNKPEADNDPEVFI